MSAKAENQGIGYKLGKFCGIAARILDNHYYEDADTLKLFVNEPARALVWLFTKVVENGQFRNSKKAFYDLLSGLTEVPEKLEDGEAASFILGYVSECESGKVLETQD